MHAPHFLRCQSIGGLVRSMTRADTLSAHGCAGSLRPLIAFQVRKHRYRLIEKRQTHDKFAFRETDPLLSYR